MLQVTPQPIIVSIGEGFHCEFLNWLEKERIEWRPAPEVSFLENLYEFAGRLCYESWKLEDGSFVNKNLTKIREGNFEYLKNIIEVDHGSVLEHGNIVILFHNVSRVFTHELVRHRVGTSMCMSGDTKIKFVYVDKNGRVQDNRNVKVEDLYESWTLGRKHQQSEKDGKYIREKIKKCTVRVLDEISSIFSTGYIENVIFSGKKEVYKVKLNNGYEIKITKEHKIFTSKGWKTINTGLTTADFVATNGIMCAGNGNYRDREYLLVCREKKMLLKEVAKECGVAIATVETWVRRLGIKWISSKWIKGRTPWNKGKKYKQNLSPDSRKRISEANKYKIGPLNPSWKGGVSKTARSAIYSWTREQASKVHEKFNYTCQNCYGDSNDYRLVTHHIIPVVQDESKAYVFDNLITVCRVCHGRIHISVENEVKFAKGTNLDVSEFKLQKKLKDYKRVLKPVFVKIDSIEKVGVEDTYDIEMRGEHKNFVANNIVVHNSQTSGRYVRYDNIKFWIPPSLERVKDVLVNAIENIETTVKSLSFSLGIDNPELNFTTKKKITSALRRITPNGIANNILFGFNGRSLRHILKMRTSEQAEEEMQFVMNVLKSKMKKEFPSLLQDF